MQALIVLALLLNVAWAVDIVCDSNTFTINPVEKRCDSGTRYCYRETDTDGLMTWGCGLCPNGPGPSCKQCVGNTDTPCNTESYETGASCYVENQGNDGLTPVDCPTDTVLCYSPSSAYTGVGPKDWSNYGCGICSETAEENNCIQCEGMACNRAYDQNVNPEDEIYCKVTTKTYIGGSIIPITLPAKCGTPETQTHCYSQPVMNTPIYTGYGCGKCPDPGTENGCRVCVGNNEKPCTPHSMDDDYRHHSHGNIMMLNTLLLPLLLALWV